MSFIIISHSGDDPPIASLDGGPGAENDEEWDKKEMWWSVLILAIMSIIVGLSLIAWGLGL